VLVCDFDDFSAENHRYDLLLRLKAANPRFRCTVFAVPALGSDRFWEKVPRWIELAVHGWHHGWHDSPPQDNPREAESWSEARMREVMEHPIVRTHFVNGFKAPGWQISDGCYYALRKAGWWVADQPYNNERRPHGLRYHLLGSENHWHGHIQNVCSNGLEETFPELLKRVQAEDEFRFVSEVLTV
jgi:hypothetical protein